MKVVGYLLGIDAVRFSIVGAVTALLYYVVLIVGVEVLEASVVVASSISYVLAVFCNYTGHYLWSFESDRRHIEAFPRHLAVNIVGFLINFSVMNEFLGASIGEYIVAQTGAIVVIVLLNFGLGKYWVYRSGIGRES